MDDVSRAASDASLRQGLVPCALLCNGHEMKDQYHSVNWAKVLQLVLGSVVGLGFKTRWLQHEWLCEPAQAALSCGTCPPVNPLSGNVASADSIQYARRMLAADVVEPPLRRSGVGGFGQRTDTSGSSGAPSQLLQKLSNRCVSQGPRGTPSSPAMDTMLSRHRRQPPSGIWRLRSLRSEAH